jgi:hypothetical protein
MILDGITSILLLLFAGGILFGIIYSVRQNTHRITREALKSMSGSFEIVDKVKVVDEKNKPFVVDHIAMSKKGIFLLKIVDRKGKISGDESQTRWREEISGRVEEFNNPIEEVIKIIRGIRVDLENVATDIPIYPIVVFHNKADLENLYSDSLVVHANEIKTYLKDDEEIITSKQMGDVKEKLIIMSQGRSPAA